VQFKTTCPAIRSTPALQAKKPTNKAGVPLLSGLRKYLPYSKMSPVPRPKTPILLPE
jgi:hypothetical protein